MNRFKRAKGLRQVAAVAVVAVCVGAVTLGLAVVPAGAVDQNGQVEHCQEGAVLVHSNGNSVWAVSGDAKYQLIAIDATQFGTFFDKKTDTLVPFGPDPYVKTWAQGNQNSDLTCTGTNTQTDPDTGAFFTIDFTVELRQVQ
jgi:DNA-binding beta-propeller fold protein YncE